MAYINGYKYFVEQDAIDARERCDAFYGIPVTSDDITQNWIEYQYAELNEPNFWYIIFDESLFVILGEPIYLEIITPLFP